MARLRLRVHPGSARDALAGWYGEALKLAVRAPPEDGRANAAVEALLAQALALPRGAVKVVAGHAARDKTVEIDGLDAATLRTRIDAWLARAG
jgi:uncharacterized protein (TIGR00251 family)